MQQEVRWSRGLVVGALVLVLVVPMMGCIPLPALSWFQDTVCDSFCSGAPCECPTLGDLVVDEIEELVDDLKD